MSASPPAATGAVRGVYVGLDELVRLQFRSRGTRFRARQAAHNLLRGRHASRMRGRGLDFERVRAYVPGDDLRTIDWRVTARTGEPHTRVFTEERDRPVLLVVDQRLSMFFGTRLSLKSVTAAEAAALAAWRVVLGGDRLGAVIFDDAGLVAHRPQRSRGQLLRILETIVTKNQALRAASDAAPAPGMLNQALERAARIAGHDHTVLVASDFDGADGETRRIVGRLARHNDVVALLVHDPASRELPAMGELGVPVLPLSTADDAATQLARLLGGATGRARRG